MSGRNNDYGRDAMIGIGTPQANPTVEAELRIVLPPACALVVNRLTSVSSDPLQRLRDYVERLEVSLDQFDTLRPDAYGFACTGSSYLIDADDEARIVERIEERLGYPVVTAAAAIRWHFAKLGIRRIALASPYPPGLSEAAYAYWSGAGFDLVGARRIDTGSGDTRSIYSLNSNDARQAVEAMAGLDVDAVLLSGTGMPSLRFIGEAADGGPHLVSSNLCLANRLCDLVGLPIPTPSDWRKRLADALGTTREAAR
jgi:maleate isomerase